MLKLRLSRGGTKKRPVYKVLLQIVVLQEMEDLLKK
jgi:ribosomal protein S16